MRTRWQAAHGGRPAQSGRGTSIAAQLSRSALAWHGATRAEPGGRLRCGGDKDACGSADPTVEGWVRKSNSLTTSIDLTDDDTCAAKNLPHKITAKKYFRAGDGLTHTQRRGPHVQAYCYSAAIFFCWMLLKKALLEIVSVVVTPQSISLNVLIYSRTTTLLDRMRIPNIH